MGKPWGRNGREHMSQNGKQTSFKFVSMIGGESLAVNGQARAAFISSCFPGIIEAPPDLLNQPLDEWQTSFRLADVLRRAGVCVLGDLHGRKVGDFAGKRIAASKRCTNWIRLRPPWLTINPRGTVLCTGQDAGG